MSSEIAAQWGNLHQSACWPMPQPWLGNLCRQRRGLPLKKQMQFLSPRQVFQPSTQTVRGSPSTSLKDKFRNCPLGGLHDSSLDRDVAKGEALEENDSVAGSCDGQMPTVPGADECHQLGDKVVDVTVSMQR